MCAVVEAVRGSFTGAAAYLRRCSQSAAGLHRGPSVGTVRSHGGRSGSTGEAARGLRYPERSLGTRMGTRYLTIGAVIDLPIH